MLDGESINTNHEHVAEDPESEDDSLIDNLLATNPRFRALVEKSKAGPRKPFPLDFKQETND